MVRMLSARRIKAQGIRPAVSAQRMNKDAETYRQRCTVPRARGQAAKKSDGAPDKRSALPNRAGRGAGRNTTKVRGRVLETSCNEHAPAVQREGKRMYWETM